jgi:DNA-binding PadR family transcriptional regulator
MAILGLLKEQELHGYELKKRLMDRLGPFSTVSFGSLYPALNRLERAGALRALEPEPAERDEGPSPPIIPMTGSIGGEVAAFRSRRAASTRTRRATAGSGSRRARKVYAITERGERLFEELLLTQRESGDDDRAFNLKLAFARYLPADARLGLLERRRAQLVQRLARARDTVRTGRERLDSYSRSLVEHSTEVTERDISWLDQLIAAERKAGT